MIVPSAGLAMTVVLCGLARWLEEKSRQHIERDIGGGTANERAVFDDRDLRHDDRKAGVRIGPRPLDDQMRGNFLRRLVAPAGL